MRARCAESNVFQTPFQNPSILKQPGHGHPIRGLAHMRMPFVLAAVAGLALAPHYAHAPDAGDCAPPDVMTEKLRAEGQRSVAMADEVANSVHRAMIFTVNADRSVGYIMRSDQDSTTKAGEFCVYRRLAGVRLYDARKPGVPLAALLKASDAEARRRCDDLAAKSIVAKDACYPLSVVLGVQERKGVRPVLQGFIVGKGADPAQASRGTLLTLVGNIVKQGKGRDPANPLYGEEGVLFYSALPEGATVDDEVLFRPQYTPYGLSLLSD